MKAFQLKIAIKNSKPPIWRRVIVPAGITFSQLSMILNEAMGWSGYHLFEFEFYHLELRIIEGADEFEMGYGPDDFIEASSTYIREYLEGNDWFTYTYDLGDDWQHRVTIEKILEDYEYNYPKVIKYKGDCPVEDCGGIYGYYECMEIISDPTHPEYEDRLSWMKSQGYPDAYDMDAVNERLEQEFFYKWGKAEKRCQGEIYEDHFAGKCGLNATHKDKNKHMPASEKQQMMDAMREFQKACEYKRQWEQRLQVTTLADIFDDFDVNSIREMAKDKCGKKLSKYTKKELIEYLTAYMLQKDEAKKYFLCLQDDEIKEFEKAVKVQGLYESKECGKFLSLYAGGYVGILEDGRVMVPRDVAAVYASFKGKEFEENRKKMSYLLCCLRTATVLYGIVPFSVFIKLVQTHPVLQITEEEVKTGIRNIPTEINEWVLVDDTIYSEDLYPDDRGLKRAQGNKEFYLPTFDEIISFGTKGYYSDSPEADKLKKFLIRKMGADIEEAEYACVIIQMQISGDCKMQDVFDVFEDLGLVLEKESHLNELINCIHALWNNTRMLLNRGFTPNELSAGKRVNPQLLQDKSKVIDFSQAKKAKIYPNDPCPCGSGKKYKNCCKNKR